MSKNWTRLLRYFLLAIALAPFVFGASFCIAVASDMGKLAGLSDIPRPPRTPAQDTFNALGRVSEQMLTAMVWFPLGHKSYISLICNSLFWAAALSASVALLRSLVRKREIPTGYCQECGYNLTGNVSGVCPECGEKILPKRQA